MNLYANRYTKYFVWRVFQTNPRLRRIVQSAFFKKGAGYVNLFGAPVYVDYQKEIGYYRASKSVSHNVVSRDEIPKIINFASILRDETVFVDCGANVGLWTAHIAKLNAVHRGLRVIAIEANPDTFRRLHKTADNFSNVECVNAALSDKARTLEMYGGAVSGIFGIYNTHFQIKDRPIRIEALPLDDLIKSDMRDIVLKIDVEGHEYEMVMGAEQAIKRGVVRAILLDGIHKSNRARTLAFLRQQGYRLYECDSLRSLPEGDDRVLAVLDRRAERQT